MLRRGCWLRSTACGDNRLLEDSQGLNVPVQIGEVSRVGRNVQNTSHSGPSLCMVSPGPSNPLYGRYTLITIGAGIGASRPVAAESQIDDL